MLGEVRLGWVGIGKVQGCHHQGKNLENEKFSRSGKRQGISFSVREI